MSGARHEWQMQRTRHFRAHRKSLILWGCVWCREGANPYDLKGWRILNSVDRRAPEVHQALAASVAIDGYSDQRSVIEVGLVSGLDVRALQQQLLHRCRVTIARGCDQLVIQAGGGGLARAAKRLNKRMVGG